MRIITLLLVIVAFALNVPAQKNKPILAKDWWKSTVVYQVYPRSFQDSNGDGIGDIKGITSRLDYLKALGIETVWLSPFFKSPMDDNGYDISDYNAVDPLFGTMQDFDELIAAMHQRKMKMVIDLVINHSSDEHMWFQGARKSRDNPYHDYYIWKRGEKGKLPNNWQSIFGGTTWEWNEATGEYYLHMFSRKQPDLNWDNPKLRQEIYKMMRFWLGKGVDGFRMDVITFISKDQEFKDLDYTKKDFYETAKGAFMDGPRLHEYLQEMNREVLAGTNAYTVGEGYIIRPETVLNYVLPERKELQTVYHFDHMNVDRESFIIPKKYEPLAMKKVLNRWNDKLQGKASNTIYFNNHDQARMLSRFGSAKFRTESGKMLATLLLTHNGIPFMYQGEELGMTNFKFSRIEEFDDLSAKAAYSGGIAQGYSPEKIIGFLNQTSRDHARTPFQWDATKNAGFSSADKTWLPVNPNHTEINAQKEQADSDSVWNYYKKLIALRGKTPALGVGTMEDLDPEHPQVYSYLRGSGKDKYWVVLNMGGETIEYKPTRSFTKPKLIMANYKDAMNWTLRPFEARIYRVK